MLAEPAVENLPAAENLSATQDLYLGRQPILDRQQQLCAFELLFRSGRQNAASFTDDVQATAVVIANAFIELGINGVLGRLRGFINVSESFLLNDVVELLPKDTVVLEVLETVRPTPQVLARCAQLRGMGYSLALDDVACVDPAFEPLLHLVEYVKIDLTQVAPGSLPAMTRAFKRAGVKLLAEKVDSRAQVTDCLALGFDYFQGYFFAKPEVIAGRRLTSVTLTLTKLIGLIAADAEQCRIEQAIRPDAALTVSLLRLTNSVAAGMRTRIKTLGAAMMVLGRRQLQRWVQLLLYAQGTDRAAGSGFSPLLQLAATRARFMELMAPSVIRDAMGEDLAFMTGIMSLMDALLGRPLAEIIEPLPFAAEVKDALLKRSGKLGALLVLCERLERDDPEMIAQALAGLPEVTLARANLAQIEAMSWANSLNEIRT